MANEVRLIDANAWIEDHCDGCKYKTNGICNPFNDPVCGAVELMHDAPTVDAVEVVHGEWCEDYETFIDDSGKESYPIQTGYVCSECGKDGYPNWHYCPNCGAKNGRLV